jgi:hypothetical protein
MKKSRKLKLSKLKVAKLQNPNKVIAGETNDCNNDPKKSVKGDYTCPPQVSYVPEQC